MFSVILILTHVRPAVGPPVLAAAVQQIIFPLSFVRLPVGPQELALAFDYILIPLAFVDFVGICYVFSVTLPQAIFEITGVDWAVKQKLSAVAVIFVIFP